MSPMECLEVVSVRGPEHRLLKNHVIYRRAPPAQPRRPAQLRLSSQPHAWNFDIAQKQPQLPGPLVVGVQTREGIELFYTLRSGEKVVESRARQGTERD